VSVPARHAHWLAQRLNAQLAPFGSGWIGMEAVLILRAEKGFILIGKDTDGVTMPHDLGVSGPRNRRKDEYVGKRSLFTPEALREDRRQLVGLVADDGALLPCGAHLVPLDRPRRSLGFVTSSHPSPTLERPVALALLEGGRDRTGTTFAVFDRGARGRATVVPPCALDPEGARLHA
jgi:sarcosine oxidase, subunit alpha